MDPLINDLFLLPKIDYNVAHVTTRVTILTTPL